MKTAKSLCLTIFALVGIALSITGNCQVYTLSTPITGSMTMSVQDSNGPAGSSGGFTFTFSNLTETVYLDTAAQTIRQVGVIFGTPSASTISFTETQQIPGIFPNPPSNVSGSVTVTLAPSGEGLAFDTGPRPLTWTPAVGAYTCDANWATLNNLEGSYSLTTGDQTYTGTFTYGLSLPSDSAFIFTFDTVSTTGYPDSLLLSGIGTQFNLHSLFVALPTVVAAIVGDNGFNMELGVGSHPLNGHLGELFVWTSPGTITATLVPASNAPVITVQPQPVAVHAHDTASFSVTASGTLPLSYQWSLNGTNISGATLSTVTIANVTQDTLGGYAVVVTNGIGSITSSNAMLSMYPFLATPFTGAVTYWGRDARFSVIAWGTGPLSYQWFQDGVAIQDATNHDLTLSGIQFTNAGLYSVVVSNAVGTVTNTPAQVLVYPSGVSLGMYAGVTIDGVVGYSYIIQRTSDLTNTNSWLTMTNLTLSQQLQLWVDTSVNASLPENPRYYYRVLPGQ